MARFTLFLGVVHLFKSYTTSWTPLSQWCAVCVPGGGGVAWQTPPPPPPAPLPSPVPSSLPCADRRSGKDADKYLDDEAEEDYYSGRKASSKQRSPAAGAKSGAREEGPRGGSGKGRGARGGRTMKYVPKT